MNDNRIEHLESRVEKLEDGQKALAVLPTQLEMLIKLQQESNQATKELSMHITETYASKELCAEKHKVINEFIQEFKEFRKWVFSSIILGLFDLLLKFYKG
jgi:hypothetical protein